MSALEKMMQAVVSSIKFDDIIATLEEKTGVTVLEARSKFDEAIERIKAISDDIDEIKQRQYEVIELKNLLEKLIKEKELENVSNS